MQPLAPDDPQVIGEYRLLRRLGSGGMGLVYLARSASGRTVAVKVVHPHFAVDEEFRRRFRREVAAARRVGGDWTAPVLDADPEASVPWVVTGYVAGPDLTRAVIEHGALPKHSVRALGAGLAEALEHVHGLGLVHRDVKPSNVLLTVDGPRLIDFGIARATDGTASLTASGASVGSPGYMPPEQAMGKDVVAASDVFSLGAVLAFAANGGAPFVGDHPAALLYKVIYEEPELDGLDGEMRELVASCLAKEPADRPSPREIADRLAPPEAGGAEGGAAGLVNAGWLPGPVVQQVSRSAVALLSLEPETTDEAASSTADQHTPTVTDGDSRATAGTPAGGTGHAAETGTGPVPQSEPASGLVEFTGHSDTPEPAGGEAPSVPSTPPPGKDPGLADAPTSGPAGAAPGDAPTGNPFRPAFPPGNGTGRAPKKKRARKVSCAVVVVVATALVALGTVELVSILNNVQPVPPAAERPADRASPSASPRPGGGGADTDEVPEAFLGVWEGEVRTRNGMTNGMLTIRMKGGEKGEDVLKLAVDVSAGGQEAVCHGAAKLDKAGEKQLRLTDRPVGPSPTVLGIKVCTEDPSPMTLTLLKDGRMRYASDSETAGRPTANLTRIDD
ncbi:serine/threonine-protein kinase [Streptomyces sp. HNM0574]|uniref:serine/threonine-protein kinase n=1 Tax=Streptomyces sp. HNM0574 TaxID=2714954 RepID=UPI00146D38A6|nr:serine/threonine-protein kinase [Streptomyces sp. HNM0574]NLU70301.1 protein kinase [Streptomyces sp. HNM0574]